MFTKGAVSITHKAGIAITFSMNRFEDADMMKEIFQSQGVNARSNTTSKRADIYIRGYGSVEKFLSRVVPLLPPSLSRERWAELRQVLIRKRLRGHSSKFGAAYLHDLDYWRFYYAKHKGNKKSQLRRAKDVYLPQIPVLQDGGSGVSGRQAHDERSPNPEVC
jgi:hypothetical protein